MTPSPNLLAAPPSPLGGHSPSPREFYAQPRSLWQAALRQLTNNGDPGSPTTTPGVTTVSNGDEKTHPSPPPTTTAAAGTTLSPMMTWYDN
jgi:hypothetical protein